MLLPFYKKNQIEAGCDEAGRGCLAGPVFAACVVLPPAFDLPLLNDSKQLSEKKRNLLRKQIETQALAFGVAAASHQEIDELNIFRATFLAMHRSIDIVRLTKQTRPDWLLIDGNHFSPYPKIPHQCIVKGDGKYASIAAASVLAKTYRDEHLLELHQQYPEYLWNKNKGYATKAHRQAIAEHGVSPFHRRSFKLFSTQLALEMQEEKK